MMNKQNGNMYPWVTHTWNPIKGKCPHDCSYCYMKRFPQKELRIDQKCFKDNLGKGNIIFVGSSCDMFAEKVPEEWIKTVFQHILMYQDNKYLFQTRNPIRLQRYFIPPFVTVGTTIESNKDYHLTKAPLPEKRYMDLVSLDVSHKMVSIEPILDFDLEIMIEWIKEIKPDFISIGADSKYHGLPEPSEEKLLNFIYEVKKNTNIKIKRNLNRIIHNKSRLTQNGEYKISNCIQSDMRCSCTSKTPKGKEYHPAVKAVYWREGANGKFVKVGYKCPNCGRWYDLKEE